MNDGTHEIHCCESLSHSGAHFCLLVNENEPLSMTVEVCSKREKFDRVNDETHQIWCCERARNELKNTMTTLQHRTIMGQLFEHRKSLTKDKGSLCLKKKTPLQPIVNEA